MAAIRRGHTRFDQTDDAGAPQIPTLHPFETRFLHRGVPAAREISPRAISAWVEVRSAFRLMKLLASQKLGRFHSLWKRSRPRQAVRARHQAITGFRLSQPLLNQRFQPVVDRSIEQRICLLPTHGNEHPTVALGYSFCGHLQDIRRSVDSEKQQHESDLQRSTYRCAAKVEIFRSCRALKHVLLKSLQHAGDGRRDAAPVRTRPSSRTTAQGSTNDGNGFMESREDMCRTDSGGDPVAVHVGSEIRGDAGEGDRDVPGCEIGK